MFRLPPVCVCVWLIEKWLTPFFGWFSFRSLDALIRKNIILFLTEMSKWNVWWQPHEFIQKIYTFIVMCAQITYKIKWCRGDPIKKKCSALGNTLTHVSPRDAIIATINNLQLRRLSNQISSLDSLVLKLLISFTATVSTLIKHVIITFDFLCRSRFIRYKYAKPFIRCFNWFVYQ